MRKSITRKTGTAMEKGKETKTATAGTGVTIGLDLGDKDHKAVVLGADGRETERREVANTEAQVGGFLGRYPGATLAIETGTHCRWVGALAKKLGLRVLTANARKTQMIWKSSRKNDWRDAEMLAKVARADASLLHPVRLRSPGDQRLMRMAKAREALVRCRTAIVNQMSMRRSKPTTAS